MTKFYIARLAPRCYCTKRVHLK